MFKRIRSRLTYANVVSTLCLFIVLGGSAYAAAKINGKNIKNRTIVAKKLKKSTLTGGEVKDGSLGQRDFIRGQLPAGPQGPAGSQGPRGITGPEGPAGPFPGVLPRGKTIRGHYGATSTYTGLGTPWLFDSISFGFTLASTPIAHVVDSATAECPGSRAFPEAAPGHLCVYKYGGNVSVDQTSRFGSLVRQDVSSQFDAIYMFGTWAVTSP